MSSPLQLLFLLLSFFEIYREIAKAFLGTYETALRGGEPWENELDPTSIESEVEVEARLPRPECLVMDLDARAEYCHPFNPMSDSASLWEACSPLVHKCDCFEVVVPLIVCDARS